jgi:hypothetical protein
MAEKARRQLTIGETTGEEALALRPVNHTRESEPCTGAVGASVGASESNLALTHSRTALHS